MRQANQIKILKDLTGVDFSYLSMAQSQYRVPGYVADVSAADAERIGAVLDKAAIKSMFFQTADGNGRIMIVDSDADVLRVQALNSVGADVGKFINPIGNINGNPVYLEPLPTQHLGKFSPIVTRSGRAIVVVNINGSRLPFYVSSGLGGKEAKGVPSGKWYPLMGIAQVWFNKMQDMNNNSYPEMDSVAQMLEKIYPAGEMRSMALSNELPYMTDENDEIFFTTVNASFPEGVAVIVQRAPGKYSIVPPELYKLNYQKYLPRVIRNWRLPPRQSFHDTPALRDKHDRNAGALSAGLNMDVFTFYHNNIQYFYFNTTVHPKMVANWMRAAGLRLTGGVQFGHKTIPGFAVRVDDVSRDNTVTQFKSGQQNVADGTSSADANFIPPTNDKTL